MDKQQARAILLALSRPEAEDLRTAAVDVVVDLLTGREDPHAAFRRGVDYATDVKAEATRQACHAETATMWREGGHTVRSGVRQAWPELADQLDALDDSAPRPHPLDSKRNDDLTGR